MSAWRIIASLFAGASGLGAAVIAGGVFRDSPSQFAVMFLVALLMLVASMCFAHDDGHLRGGKG